MHGGAIVKSRKNGCIISRASSLEMPRHISALSIMEEKGLRRCRGSAPRWHNPSSLMVLLGEGAVPQTLSTTRSDSIIKTFKGSAPPASSKPHHWDLTTQPSFKETSVRRIDLKGGRIYDLEQRRRRSVPAVDGDGPVLSKLLLGFMHLANKVDESFPRLGHALFRPIRELELSDRPGLAVLQKHGRQGSLLTPI